MTIPIPVEPIIGVMLARIAELEQELSLTQGNLGEAERELWLTQRALRRVCEHEAELLLLLPEAFRMSAQDIYDGYIRAALAATKGE